MESNWDSAAMICVIVAIGMSAAFLFADRGSPITRLLSSFLICIGLSIHLNATHVRSFGVDAANVWAYLAPLATGGALIFGAEWILRIRRMLPTNNLRTRFGDMQLRLAQGMALVYVLVGVPLTQWRAEYFVGAITNFAVFSDWRFWLFAGPFGLAVLAIMDGCLITLRRCPDPPEAIRLAGIAAASPLIAAGLIVEPGLAPIISAIGQMIFLVACVQYHVLQGQRGQFMARFLAPSVAGLVRDQGLDEAMRRRKLDVTVVACDLRGYTAFAESVDSTQAIAVLDHFYDSVGRAAAETGATIKDYAGDGVMLLVGAPVPAQDREERALRLARGILESSQNALAELGADLAVGVGVATGPLSVGVIGRARLEYVAVGRAINLAARLCQQAEGGQILIDDATRNRLDSPDQAQAAASLQLKGLTGPVMAWQL